MTARNLTLCTIHGVRFEQQDADGAYLNCPACSRKDIARLTAELKAVTEHRELLLRAIDLKRTLVNTRSKA